jgi:hypothetical protein
VRTAEAVRCSHPLAVTPNVVDPGAALAETLRVNVALWPEVRLCGLTLALTPAGNPDTEQQERNCPVPPEAVEMV